MCVRHSTSENEAPSCKVMREPAAVHSRATVSPVRRGRLTLTSFIHWEMSTARSAQEMFRKQKLDSWERRKGQHTLTIIPLHGVSRIR